MTNITPTQLNQIMLLHSELMPEGLGYWVMGDRWRLGPDYYIPVETATSLCRTALHDELIKRVGDLKYHLRSKGCTVSINITINEHLHPRAFFAPTEIEALSKALRAVKEEANA